MRRAVEKENRLAGWITPLRISEAPAIRQRDRGVDKCGHEIPMLSGEKFSTCDGQHQSQSPQRAPRSLTAPIELEVPRGEPGPGQRTPEALHNPFRVPTTLEMLGAIQSG